MQNATPDPIVVRVDHLGTLCPGDCLTWEIRALIDPDGMISEAALTPDLCNALDVYMTHSDILLWENVWFTIYATINGEPFGETIILTTQNFGTCTEPAFIGPWMSITDSVTTPPPDNQSPGSYVSPYDTLFPNAAFTMDFAPTGPAPITFCVGDEFALTTIGSITGGDPAAYGDFTLVTYWSLGGTAGLRLAADGSHDYTGITVTFAPLTSDSLPFGPAISVTSA